MGEMLAINNRVRVEATFGGDTFYVSNEDDLVTRCIVAWKNSPTWSSEAQTPQHLTRHTRLMKWSRFLRTPRIL